MQIKTTLIYTCQNLSSINQQTTNAGKDVEKGEPFCTVGGTQTSAATVESNMEIPQKLKIDLSFDPVIPTSWNIPKEAQNTNSKEHKHPYVYCSIIYNCQDMEAAQVSISR